jgi:hypothetical protein
VSFFETYQRTPQISREVLQTEMPRAVKESVLAFLRERMSSDSASTPRSDSTET